MTNNTDLPAITAVLNREMPAIRKLPFYYSVITVKRFTDENKFEGIKLAPLDATPRQTHVYCMPFYKRISKCF